MNPSILYLCLVFPYLSNTHLPSVSHVPGIEVDANTRICKIQMMISKLSSYWSYLSSLIKAWFRQLYTILVTFTLKQRREELLRENFKGDVAYGETSTCGHLPQNCAVGSGMLKKMHSAALLLSHQQWEGPLIQHLCCIVSCKHEKEQNDAAVQEHGMTCNIYEAGKQGWE
jgi:hypothetical protein